MKEQDIMNNPLLILGLLLSLSTIGCAGNKKASLQTGLPPETTVSGETFDEKYPANASDPFRLEQLRETKQYARNSRNMPPELTKLLDMRSSGGTQESKSSVKQLRPETLKEVADLIGFQTAMSWQYGNLLEETEKFASSLDQTFNFAPLVIMFDDSLVLPPILTKANSSIRLEDYNMASSSTKTFELLQDARFISVVPSWRIYLMADNFPNPEQPHPALLPRTEAERDVWREGVLNGWNRGIVESNYLYSDNVARLTRDYKGVLLFHMLAAEKILTEPNLAKANFGVHVSNNKMFIDQKVFRITKPSEFNKDSKKWKTLIN